jgi:amino acid transporter
LVRAIGRWTLTALVVNSVIGSGIFGLPGDVARQVGHAAPLAYLMAALGIGVIMACFAEVGSQFREAGGPYLYARETFGRFTGIQTGWLAWLVRLTSAAANANLFVVYLGELWPQATNPGVRAAILSVLVWMLAAVNLRGVSAGAKLSNVFTIAKLAPIAVFILAGLYFYRGNIPIGWQAEPMGHWLQAILALIFAYGGFEAALMPMAEVKEPRKDTPFALLTGLAVVAVVYMLIHVVVMSALADPGATKRPVAEAAREFLGPAGASLIALGALVSMYGYLSGQFVSAPRIIYAFAERRDFPAVIARVHERFRTPYVAILLYTVLVWLLAIYGSFIWNAILSAVARLFTYGVVCAAVIALRKKQPGADAFRLPVGWVFAALGIAFCLVLAAQMDRNHLLILLVTAAVALGNWLMVRRGAQSVSTTP